MSATGLRRTIALSWPRRLAVDPALALVAGATLLGLGLRAAASAGDLGLDEVWSLKLVAGVQTFGAVLWGISHDNNHLLNSSWLYLLGQDAPVWADRAPAVLLGTLTVPALARLCGRRGPAAGALAAILGAVALPLVDFGSEARGYAGLALATVLALDAGGRAVDAATAGDRDGSGREAWRLGAAVGFGLLCHLTMAYALAVILLAALIRSEAHRRPRAAFAMMWRLFMPSALLAVPALGAFLAGLAVRGSFTIGDSDPFTVPKLVDGFGAMALLTAGLPDTVPSWLGAAGALALLATAARHRLAPAWTVALGVAALIALPLAVAALRLPNVVYPRYFSICAIVLLALLADVLGTLWARRGEARRAAALAAAAMIAGSLMLDVLEIRQGRGGFTDTLAMMEAEGPTTYGANRPFMVALLLDEAARRVGHPAATPIPEAQACRAPPNWYIAAGTFDTRPEAGVEAGPAACPAHYSPRRAFAASPLSGTVWTLYRRG